MDGYEKDVHVKANRRARPYTGQEPRFQRQQIESDTAFMEVHRQSSRIFTAVHEENKRTLERTLPPLKIPYKMLPHFERIPGTPDMQPVLALVDGVCTFRPHIECFPQRISFDEISDQSILITLEPVCTDTDPTVINHELARRMPQVRRYRLDFPVHGAWSLTPLDEGGARAAQRAMQEREHTEGRKAERKRH